MTEDNKLLLEILRCSLWDAEKQGEEIPDHIRTELCDQTVEGLTAIAYSDTQNLKYEQTARFVNLAHLQRKAIQQLQSAGIPVVVIKGMAAGFYYPHPQLRTYGDIDLLVPPEHYAASIKQMRENGYSQQGDIGSYHTALWKDEVLFELHQSPPHMEDVPEGEYMLRFMREGFGNIQTGVIESSNCVFPMLPWQQNGLELIWHFREHLYNGIGLRHVIDWMMFVNACLDDLTFQQYKSVLEQAGLLTLAKTVTKMCQLYLGLKEESITWCSDVTPSLCAELMNYIFEQGNFGTKKTDDKAAKVLTRYRRPIAFLKGMQRKGLNEWPAAQKHPYLKPFAWLYVGILGAKSYLSPAGWETLKIARTVSSQRKKLFDQLFGEKTKK